MEVYEQIEAKRRQLWEEFEEVGRKQDDPRTRRVDREGLAIVARNIMRMLDFMEPFRVLRERIGVFAEKDWEYSRERRPDIYEAVSYTHLTLPTKA